MAEDQEILEETQMQKWVCGAFTISEEEPLEEEEEKQKQSWRSSAEVCDFFWVKRERVGEVEGEIWEWSEVCAFWVCIWVFVNLWRDVTLI